MSPRTFARFHPTDPAAHAAAISAAIAAAARTPIACNGSGNGTGSGAGTSGQTYGRAATGTTAGSVYAWGVRDIVWCAGQIPGTIDWTKPVDIEFWIYRNRSDADSVFRVLCGKRFPLTAGALAVAGFGFEMRANNALWLVAHNGTTLTEVNAAVTLATGSSRLCRIRSNADGTCTITIAGTDYTVTGGPTSSTSAAAHLSVEVVSTTGTTNTYIDIVTPRYKECQ